MFSLILAFGFVSYVEDIKCKVVQYAGPHISGDKFIYFFPNHQPEGIILICATDKDACIVLYQYHRFL